MPAVSGSGPSNDFIYRAAGAVVGGARTVQEADREIYLAALLTLLKENLRSPKHSYFRYPISAPAEKARETLRFGFGEDYAHYADAVTATIAIAGTADRWDAPLIVLQELLHHDDTDRHAAAVFGVALSDLFHGASPQSAMTSAVSLLTTTEPCDALDMSMKRSMSLAKLGVPPWRAVPLLRISTDGHFRLSLATYCLLSCRDYAEAVNTAERHREIDCDPGPLMGHLAGAAYWGDLDTQHCALQLTALFQGALSNR